MGIVLITGSAGLIGAEAVRFFSKKGMANLAGNPQAILLTVLLSFPIWSFDLLSLFFSDRAINFDLSASLTVIAGITAFIAQAIPTTPAGIGVHEGTIAGVLLLFNIDAGTGTSIALVDHFARGAIIFIFGTVSAIHLGFESRKHLTELKKQDIVGVVNEQ